VPGADAAFHDQAKRAASVEGRGDPLGGAHTPKHLRHGVVHDLQAKLPNRALHETLLARRETALRIERGDGAVKLAPPWPNTSTSRRKQAT
jgi:hypothetical protein